MAIFRDRQSQSMSPESLWWTIVRLLRWDKPEGRLILMVPALWAVFLAARGYPSALLVGIIILGSLATSAAGCVVNDLWDRNIDPQVERTKNRPLASRALSVQVGIGVMLVGFLCAYGLALFLNPLTFWLCVAAVPVIVIYPAMKRVFPVPQLVLSIAWGFAVLISWSAVSCGLTPSATACLGQETWLLWGATLCWTMGFDTVYALSDREDDRKLGVNSSALFFGTYAPQAIAVFYIATTIILGKLGQVMQLDWPFWVSLAIAAIAWAWQALKLTQPRIPHPFYAAAFKQNVGIGFVLLAGMIAGVWWNG
ncbi:4-hydroxybenzoate solanesyltransferase [Alkalinema sp. FACHB-956]|uniref:4-hydroxybenzoate solanesyltransferase n=1 Tax=Alkalinema sp. FACHB-956 TaxID=2692768 RepID=UPI001687A4A6|nr:4-hydroxybenzoate solanesyltransferase [Alkalinema sp. FACHB-956]MBD2326954.1 4-hydroxybenzoate solanesyltransferase [Alkalinema sp. FACHB-956]